MLSRFPSVCFTVMYQFGKNTIRAFSSAVRNSQLSLVYSHFTEIHLLCKKTGGSYYEIRYRSFFPISFMHSNLYEMS